MLSCHMSLQVKAEQNITHEFPGKFTGEMIMGDQQVKSITITEATAALSRL